MGNSNSVIDFEYKITANDYKPLQRVKDPRLGELVQMKNSKTGHIVLRKEKRLSDPESYERKMEDCMNHLSIKHKNLAKIYGFASSDNHDTLKNQHKIFIYFELLHETLHDIIFKRKVPLSQRANNGVKANNYFSETELLGIMNQLIDVLEYLQCNSITHGEIRPDTCYFTKEGVKIMNRNLINGETSTFEQVKKGDRNMFLTPVAFEAIKKKQEEPIEDRYKTDVFGLGMTLLECATLKSSTQIYDWNNFTLNLSILSTRLLEIKERYSFNFYKVLREMLRMQEDQRPDFIALKKYLNDQVKGSLNSVPSHLPTEEEIFGKERIFTVEPNKVIKAPNKPVKDSKENQSIQELFPVPTKAISLQKATPMTKNTQKEISSAGIGRNMERQGRSARKVYYDEENIEDDVEDGGHNLKINKIPQRAVHRSADKFRTVNSFQAELTSERLKRIVHNKNSNNETPAKQILDIRVRHFPINDQLADKVTKAVTKTSQTFQAPQKTKNSFNTLNSKLDDESNLSLFKPSFLQSKKNSPDSSCESEGTVIADFHVHCGSKNQYNYKEKQIDKSRVSIEQLVQQAVLKSERLRSSIRETQIELTDNNTSNICSSPQASEKKSKKLASHYSSVQSFHNKNPMSLVGSQVLTNIPEPVYPKSNNTNQKIMPAKRITSTATPFDKSSPSEKSRFSIEPHNLPASLMQSPSQKSVKPISGFNSISRGDSLRSSFQPEICDMMDNMNEVNKNLIDCLIKSTFTSRPFEEQRQSKQVTSQKACIPSFNIDLRGISSPNFNEGEKKPKDEKSPLSFNQDYYSVNLNSKKEMPNNNAPVIPVTFDTNKRVNTLSEAQLKRSKEDPIIDVTDTRQLKTERYIENEREKALAKKREEDAEIQKKILQAIERSKKTYEYAANIDTRIPTPGLAMFYSSQPGGSLSERIVSAANYASVGQSKPINK